MPAPADAFLELVRSHGPRLLRLASGYARAEDRRDLVQQMWLAIWRALPGFRGDAALSTWAYRIAINTAVSHVRKDVRRREQAAASAPEPVAPGGRDERAILEEFLEALGPVDRAAMALYLEGLAASDIGAVLGATEGAVAVRLSRIKALFKQRYLGSER